MIKYRISKYNPNFRNDNGLFLNNEWTSYSDIGKVYGDKVFSEKEYVYIEKRYCDAIAGVLKEQNINNLRIYDLELNFSIEKSEHLLKQYGLALKDHEKKIIASLKNGNIISSKIFSDYFRLLLRECFWCKFKNKTSTFCIEVGYDYYAYIYCAQIAPDTISYNKNNGIFIEEVTQRDG